MLPRSRRRPLAMLAFVLLLHFVVGTALIASGDRFGARSFLLAAVAPAVSSVLLLAAAPGVIDGDPVTGSIGWVDQLDLTIDLRLDAMALTMSLIVVIVGVLVCVYAVGYFSHPKAGIGRLAGLLCMFAGAMLGVAMSDHLLSLFVFWELTSVTSYLLIGNSDHDPRARSAARSAILITGMGGLVLLGGIVLLGQSAGTYRISELIADPPSGDAVSVAAVLILIGAFTKSAQFPFGGWLPGAMVAPTPISTYLHAATMVKAGVFLVARLAPALAEVDTWRPLLLPVASVTMFFGAWRALRQYDLKLLLAYGTVSQLGFLMLLLGAGEYPIAQAGVVLLIAHAAFKAALFMVVGIVDHQVGSRDIRDLRGFGPGWRPVVLVSVLGAASMAGVPPLLGFIAKEKGLDGYLEASFAGGTSVLIVIVAGSMLTFAYSSRFVLGVMGRFAEPANDQYDSVAAPPPSVPFVGPAALMAAASLLFGVAPVLVDELVRTATQAMYPGKDPKNVVLWAGFNTALVLSVVIIAVGVVLVVLRAPVERFQRRFHRLIEWVPDSDRAFNGAVDGVTGFGRRTTAILQNGSLPAYLVVILAVVAIAPLGPAIASFDSVPDVIGDWFNIPIGALIIAGTFGATVLRRRIAAVLMLGAVGFGMGAFYVVQGAPDLALTQFAIETLATVLFVLVLRFLPPRFVDEREAIRWPVRLAVATAVGVGAFVLAIVASESRADVTEPPVSEAMLERSVSDGEGANVVNVILVDFRGLDTLGEITVLAVAAIGLVALARAARQPGDGRGRDEPRFARLPVVDASVRLLYPSILVLAVYFLFAGHNQPGGGFVGGLTAGAAISLRYVAGGLAEVRSLFRFRPWTVLGGGLALAGATATIPLLLGESVLEHTVWEADVPVLGKIKATSALPFDIGVFLVVVGLVLMAYEAFGEEAEPDETDGDGGSAPANGSAGASVNVGVGA